MDLPLHKRELSAAEAEALEAAYTKPGWRTDRSEHHFAGYLISRGLTVYRLREGVWDRERSWEITD